MYPKKCKSITLKAPAHPCFFAASFTIAKLWKQPRCPTTDEQIFLNVVFINSGILFSHKEECNFVICR
jgi:hypothetical protein